MLEVPPSTWIHQCCGLTDRIKDIWSFVFNHERPYLIRVLNLNLPSFVKSADLGLKLQILVKTTDLGWNHWFRSERKTTFNPPFFLVQVSITRVPLPCGGAVVVCSDEIVVCSCVDGATRLISSFFTDGAFGPHNTSSALLFLRSSKSNLSA